MSAIGQAQRHWKNSTVLRIVSESKRDNQWLRGLPNHRVEKDAADRASHP
jgi:hypothetical protein